MSGNIRCTSNQRRITDLLDLNYIICNQTVASLDQLQSGLRFTDTTLTHDQNTFAIYIDQYSMYGYSWCQFYMEPTVYLMYKCRCNGT